MRPHDQSSARAPRITRRRGDVDHTHRRLFLRVRRNFYSYADEGSYLVRIAFQFRPAMPPSVDPAGMVLEPENGQGSRMGGTVDEFSQFFDCAWPRVHGYALRRVGVDAAPDIASEALLTAWVKWESAPDGDSDSLIHWVLAIARNKVFHEWRNRQAQQRLAETLCFASTTAPSAADSAEAEAMAHIGLVAAFNELAEDDQRALLDDPWPKRGSAHANPSSGAAAMRRSRARARFRESMR